MTFSRKEVRRFFYRLGFLEAPTWDDDLLRSKCLALSRMVSEESVPEKYRGLFADLKSYSDRGDFIPFTSIPAKPTRKK